MDETPDDPDTPSEDGTPRPAPQPTPATTPPPTPAVTSQPTATSHQTPLTPAATPQPPRVPSVVLVEQPRPPRRFSRRWFVAGAGALVVGGAAGVALDFARGRPTPARPPALPNALRAALAEERTLLAAARAARRSGGDVPAGVAAALVRDHEAHLAALSAAAAGFAHRGPAGAASSAEPEVRAHLRRRERRAAQHAAERAGRLTGDTAALLASIAACEATHVELLS